MTDDERAVLAHLHANDRQTPAQLASILGLERAAVDAAVASLLDAGHLERDGEHLRPDAASRATPGLFIASERGSSEPQEVEPA